MNIENLSDAQQDAEFPLPLFQLVAHFNDHRRELMAGLEILDAGSQLKWRNGFVARAVCHDTRRNVMHRWAAHLRSILTAPSCQFLIGLDTIGLPTHGLFDLARVGGLEHPLRELSLESGSRAPVRLEVCSLFPNLETLELTGDCAPHERIPRTLRHLRLGQTHTHRLWKEHDVWPALEVLHIEPAAHPTDLATLLSGRVTPQLHSLSLTLRGGSDDLSVNAVLVSGLLPRLRTLRLSAVSARVALTLRDKLRKLEHLDALDLRGSVEAARLQKEWDERFDA